MATRSRARARARARARLAILLVALALQAVPAVADTGHAVGDGTPEPSGQSPEPWMSDSHELFLRQLDREDEQAYTRLLSIYDDYLERHPLDASTAVERCRFIESARYDEDDDEFNPNYEAFEECRAQLEARFPSARPVILSRLEGQWGEEAIATARALIAEGLDAWPSPDVARVYRHLAIHLDRAGDLREAARAAWEAMKRDPSIDLTLVLARYWKEEGEEENALNELRRHFDSPAEPWVLGQKAELLVDLGSYDLAIEIYRKLDGDPSWYPDRVGYARALEGGGDLQRARDQYSRAAEDDWDKTEARRRIFRFDLEHRESWAATASYEAFRESDFWADPLLRHRLDLALKHPSASWGWRDGLGVLAILVVALLVAALPGFWILPIHYIGLLRAARRPASQESSRWGLRHCWYVSALLLLVECFAIYWFYYHEFDAFVENTLSTRAGDAPNLAQMALTTLVLTFLGLLPLLRRGDYRVLFHSDWSARWTVIITLAVLAVLWIALSMPVSYLVEEWERADAVAFAGGLPVATTMTMKIIEALGLTYGLAVQAAFVALLAPVCEEIVFRGVILSGCSRHLPFGWANLVQASLFTVSHESLAYYPVYFGMGLMAGMLARRSGGLAAPVLLHVANNAAALAMIRAGGL